MGINEDEYVSVEFLEDLDIDIGISTFVEKCHRRSKESGWWKPNPNIAEKLALIHSEISEALEADRKNLMDEKLPHFKGIGVELADAMIRIADLAGYLNIDLGSIIIAKMEYNRTRADHKPENREKDGGKKY